MARTIRDANLGSRTARQALAVRGYPYYRSITMGLHIGYYKGARSGTWFARRFLGDNRYEETKIAAADDTLDADGVTILSFNQAQEWAREWFRRRTMADAGHEGQTAAGYTVGDALDEYMRDYARRGGRAGSEMKYALDAHIRSTLGTIEVTKLTRQKLEHWLDALANAPPRLRVRKGLPQKFRERDDSEDGVRRRRATANRVLTILKSTLNLAYQHRKITTKDAWEAVKPYREADAPKIRYLTDEEITRLINASPSPFKELVVAALLTGARYGELAAMTVGDFDHANGAVYIPRSKSGKARHIHLTDEGLRFFASLANGKKTTDLLLTHAEGKPWGASHQFRWMHDACEAAEITPAISFHILRHTYASRLAMKGVPMPVIAAQLGHTDTRMTERHYAHLAPSYVADTVRAAFAPLGLLEEMLTKSAGKTD